MMDRHIGRKRILITDSLLVTLISVALWLASAPFAAAQESKTQEQATESGLVTIQAPAGFKVVGYFPEWSGVVSDVQFDKLTHVNYAFVNPNNGVSVQSVPNPGKLRSLVTAAHARGKKVLIAIGGWTNLDNRGFERYAASDSSRTDFVNRALSIVNSFNLDGVDIDWEYPRAGAQARNYRALMQKLSTALRSRGKLCTAAVAASGSNADGILKEVFGYVDFLNLMAYDGGTAAAHSPYSYAVSTLDYWLGRGLPKSKAILGVPFYGRGRTWSDSDYRAYKDIVARDSQAPNKDLSNGIHYNGIPTMKRKTQLALQRAGGVMIWELSQDTKGSTSLLNAINQSIAASRFEGVTASSGDEWQNKSFEDQTGMFTAEFDVIPSTSSLNGVVGLSSEAQASYTGFAVQIRFNKSGYIEARNGVSYVAVSPIFYSAGAKYHFRVVVDVPARTYSVFVTGPEGIEQNVASSFAFRMDQYKVTSLNNWGVYVSTSKEGSLTVSNFALK